MNNPTLVSSQSEIMRSTFKLLFFVKRNVAKKNGNLPTNKKATIRMISG